MKILFVNIGNFGSTGKIVREIGNLAEKKGNTVLKCYPELKINFEKKPDEYIICSNFFRKMNNALGIITGLHGFFSVCTTKRLIKEITKFKPDIIHLHNVHSSYLNYKILFNYLKKSKITIVWTLHDCWSFTGRCPHFVLEKCEKWKTGCSNCTYPKDLYPQSMIDRTQIMWSFKKELFSNIPNMNIVTPSRWLAGLVKESFLKDYPLYVINNGLNLDVFKPMENNFREKHDIPHNKYVLLGVSFGWGARKGLDVFIELAKRLPDNYQIVLVGTDDAVDKQLPSNILSIHRTQNQKELAEIYTAADLFVNPTREEVLGMVNIESLACGTPVVTFRTGGSPEILDETCGSVVACDDIDGLEKEIVRICENKPFSTDDCLKRARSFDMNVKFQEYIDLYEKLGEQNA